MDSTIVIVAISLALAYWVTYKIDPMASAAIQKKVLKKKKVEESSKGEREIAFFVCWAAIMFILFLLFGW